MTRKRRSLFGRPPPRRLHPRLGRHPASNTVEPAHPPTRAAGSSPSAGPAPGRSPGTHPRRRLGRGARCEQTRKHHRSMAQDQPLKGRFRRRVTPSRRTARAIAGRTGRLQSPCQTTSGCRALRRRTNHRSSIPSSPGLDPRSRNRQRSAWNRARLSLILGKCEGIDLIESVSSTLGFRFGRGDDLE